MRKQVEGQKQAESEIGGRNYLYPCNGRFPPRQPWKRRPVQTVRHEKKVTEGEGRGEKREWSGYSSDLEEAVDGAVKEGISRVDENIDLRGRNGTGKHAPRHVSLARSFLSFFLGGYLRTRDRV